VGYVLEVAQRGGKAANAKPLKGFGGASVLEIVAMMTAIRGALPPASVTPCARRSVSGSRRDNWLNRQGRHDPDRSAELPSVVFSAPWVDHSSPSSARRFSTLDKRTSSSAILALVRFSRYTRPEIWVP
jgi:hypothetical protein